MVLKVIAGFSNAIPNKYDIASNLMGEGFHSNLIEKTKIKRVQIKIKTTKNLHPQVRSLAEFQVEFCENPSCILFAALSID